MFAKMFCGTCHDEYKKLHNVQSVHVNLFLLRGDINDDLVIVGKCPKGHNVAWAITKAKFAIIFDMGMYAYYDGYYREAVVSFASALERIYEFYIRVVCLYRKSEQNMINSTWKNMSSHSERQLGAFCLAHLLENNQPPKLLKDRSVQFRNSVIHKGDLPTKARTFEFFEEIFNLCNNIIMDMRSRYQAEAKLVELLEWMPRCDKYKNAIDNANLGLTASRGILPYIGPDAEDDKFNTMSFEEKLSYHENEDNRYLFPETISSTFGGSTA